MPPYPDASPPPRKDRGETLGIRPAIEPAAPSMFVLSLGTTRLYLTYALPIAVAACLAVVMVVRDRPEVGDLTMAFLVGGLFWLAGCVVQVVSHLAVWGVWGEPCESVTIGLLGIEFPPIHQSPRRLTALSVVTILPLVLSAAASTLVGVAWAGEAFWMAGKAWTLPSLGLSDSDRVWQAGGVLLVIQLLCQAFPLPRTPGRQVVLAVTAASLRHLDLPRIVLVARRSLVMIAIIVAMIALALVRIESNSPVQRWPILLLIAVMLWVSSRGDDVELAIWSLVNAESAHRGPIHASWVRRRVQYLQSISGRRRVRRALAKEHGEAVDASRLDEILARLHDEGEKSLSNDDRAVLRRVSETLRTHRRDSHSEIKP